MKYTCFGAAVVGVIWLAGVGAAKPRPADTKAASFDGVWRVVSLEAEGKKAPAEAFKDWRWTFRGEHITISAPNEKGEKMTFALQPTAKPKAIDVTSVEGTFPGQKLQGIYEEEDGRLKICLRDRMAAAEGRPTMFDGGRGLGVIVLERVKEK